MNHHLTIRLSEDFHIEYKDRCRSLGKTMSDDLCEYIARMLKNTRGMTDEEIAQEVKDAEELPAVHRGRPKKAESQDPARWHFWIRKQNPDRIVLSFNTIERCEEITELLTDEGGELLAD